MSRKVGLLVTLIHSKGAERDECDPLLPLPFSSDWEPSSRNVPTVPVSFLTVVSPVKKVLPRHAQMFIS